MTSPINIINVFPFLVFYVSEEVGDGREEKNWKLMSLSLFISSVSNLFTFFYSPDPLYLSFHLLPMIGKGGIMPMEHYIP